MDKKIILIVDDPADARLVLSARLNAHHAHVVFAADALQAMSVARTERPDVILLDLSLPGGNGSLVLQRLNAHTSLARIPVIIVSAEDPQGAEARTVEGAQSRSFKSPWTRQAHGSGAARRGNNLRPILKA